MVRASRRSVVLVGAVVGLLHRPSSLLAQESGGKAATPDDPFTCVSMLARNPATTEEEHERIIDLAAALGMQRAELLGQPYSPADLVYALSLLCQWPFKPLPDPEYRAFRDAILPMIVESGSNPMEIAGRFPDEALTLDFGELFRGLEDGSLLPLIELGFEGFVNP